MKLLRYILFPIVPVYYLVTKFRNVLYNHNIKSSEGYDFPVICVGNLSVGGTGKTPMIEYLIRLLKADYKLATLSRGYKRKTKGFVVTDECASALTVGDEPFQFYKKFNDIVVSVDADRRNGIGQLMALKDQPDVILLDDAFQHRKVKAGFYILLTSYDCLYSDDFMLPTGNLREPRSGAKRANIIVVTKCPETISGIEKRAITNRLKPLQHQEVFFSHISYSDEIRNTNKSLDIKALSKVQFTLVTGIANPKPLVDFLSSKGLKFEHLNFKDHHEFSKKELENLKERETILTTEKDFMRLEPHFVASRNLFYLPIEVHIDGASKFESLVKNFTNSY